MPLNRPRAAYLATSVPQPASSANTKAPSPTSSCTKETVLPGLSWLKGQAPVVALADEEYPPWLWTILESRTFTEEEMEPGSIGFKAKMRKERKAKIRLANFMKTQMKRNPRKVRWTKAFRKAAGKEMTIDSTIEFEKLRNVPVRYDRDLVQTTIKAMKRVAEIKQRRERAFWKHRMAVAREKRKTSRSRAKERLYQREAARDAAIAASYEQPDDVELAQASDELDMVKPLQNSTSERVIIKERAIVKDKKKLQRSSALVAGSGRSMGMEMD
ncbi:ATPase-activating ribosome biosynthesis protein [Serendipita sp. 399]|nr:ATPase-activating ribosome biosynthesis protein [Serendipita sp. 399]